MNPHEIQVNDIALLKLTAPLKFSEKVQPAKLPYSYPPRDAVIVARGLDEVSFCILSIVSSTQSKIGIAMELMQHNRKLNLRRRMKNKRL